MLRGAICCFRQPSRDPAALPSDGDEEDLDEREVAAAAAIALAASRRQQQ
tara:strand:- start:2681 stop:2830 length:150 start_codon:yes stop_codon:yes gene_type:complete